MVYVQFEYLYKKRSIYIEGDIDEKVLHYVTLLQKVSERFQLDSIANFLARLLNYQNQELGSVLFVLFSIIITESVSHFMFNTMQQGGFAHLSLLAMILYTFVVHILFQKKYKIYVVGVLEILLSMTVGIMSRYKVNDFYIVSKFLALNTALLLIGIAKQMIEKEMNKKIFAVYEFESNFLIAIYLVQKFSHFYYPYLEGEPLDAYNLIPGIICVSLINGLKIWNLFDFNTVYLISLLITVQKQKMREMEKISLIENILELGQELHNSKKVRKNLNESPFELSLQGITKNISKISFVDKKTSTPSNVFADQNEIVQYVDQLSSQQASRQILQNKMIGSPYTVHIWLPFALNFIFSVALITLVVLRIYTDSELYLMSVGMFKATIMMLYCEQQAVIMAQGEKHAFYYFLYILSDLFLVGHLIVMYAFYEYFEYSTDYCSFSLVIHAFVPFLTRTMYRSFSQLMIQAHSNSNIIHFYCFWIFLLSIRQTLLIVIKATFTQTYLVIDTFLLVHFVLVFVVVGKNDFYQWIWQQLEKMRKMRKYKLYVMESLRNWKYDISGLNQSFFVINSIIFFLGYNQFNKLSHENSKLHKTEYFIICGSALVVHLLQCYNNFFTQRELQALKKPKYSPYANYLILTVCIAVYVAVSFLTNFSPDAQTVEKHKRYSLLCAALTLFLIFTNIFGHYSYQTVQQFRHVSKLINLVISYFIFYYPFITFFTVFFFMQNLETEYLFRYAIVGFAYLTVVSVIMGIMVHAILNLTEKSKRTLFLIKALSEEFKKINMKQDPEFISMIENLYDFMDSNAQKLLQQLQAQKISQIIFHDDANAEYDYSIVQPDKKKDEFVKVFADILERHLDRDLASKRLRIDSVLGLSNKKIQTKRNFYKRKADEQNPIKSNIQRIINSQRVENKNQPEIRRLIEAVSVIKAEELVRVNKTVQNFQEFRDLLKDEEKVRKTMHRFFHFLSYPSESLGLQVFNLLNSLHLQQTIIDLSQEFNRFSKDGQQINEEGFRNYIVNLVKLGQKENSQIQTTESANRFWKDYLSKHLLIFMSKGNDIFKYYMKRKNVEMDEKSRKIWGSTKNEDEERQMVAFKQNYNLRKNRAMGKKDRLEVSFREEKSSSQLGLIKTKEEIISAQESQLQAAMQQANDSPLQNKKHILFMSSDSIYDLIVSKLVQTLEEYEKAQHEHFQLQKIKLGLSNIVSILTKLFDFTYLYMYGSIYAMHTYATEDFSNSKHALSFINYNIIFGVALAGVVAYAGLILFHKKELANGSLGVDENQRAISLTSLKFYTTFLLFLMGSSLSNVFIMTSLNSYICEEHSQRLWNFPDNECYTTSHMGQMFGSLLMLLTYYPLASLIFPFSSAIDHTLQIKYKAEYEIIYLQSKFLVNGINVIFNRMDFQEEELIKSITKTFLLIVLAFLFHKLRPCSVQFINRIQLHIYLALIIVNAAGILCYFVGLQFTLIITGIALLLYCLYLLCNFFKIVNTDPTQTNNYPNNLVDERFKKQQIFKIRLRHCNQNILNAQSDTSLVKTKNLCLYQDLTDLSEKHTKLQPENHTKLQHENPFKKPQPINGKTEKFKRKHNSNFLTIKMGKKSQQLSSKTQFISIQ